MNLPSVVRIGDVAEIKGGKRLPKGEVVHSETTPFPYLRVVDFTDHGVDLENVKFITPEAKATIARYTISTEDIYISIAGTVGRVGIIPENLSGANLTENAAKITLLDPCIEKNYLMYFLRSSLGQGQILSKAGGAAQPKLALYRIAEIEFPAPLLETQQRIAAILGAYDDLIEVNRRRVAVLEEMARGLFEEWFVRLRFPGHEDVPIVDTPDGPLPEGWEWGRFSQIAPEVRETLAPSSVDPETPYLGLEHFPRRSTTLADRGAAKDVDSTKSRFSRGDILFGKIRPYFHKVIWAPFDGISSTDAIIWRPDPGCAARALMLASSDAFVAHSVQTSNGTKMPRANSKVLANYPCVIPKASISKQFEGLVMPAIELAAKLQQASEKLAASRDHLLPRLISGQLCVETAERQLENAA